MGEMVRRGIVVFCALSAILFTAVLNGHAGSAAAAPTERTSVVPSPTGPGYQLLVSNTAYGYNAPALSSLPTNPTGGGPQICPPQTSGTCSDIGIASTGDNIDPGYWIGTAARFVAGNGQVQYGGAVTGLGDTDTCNHVSAVLSNTPVVGVASAQFGALLAAADGGVFSFCGAPFYGSMGGTHLNQPIVGMAATPDGKGYWLVASDGGVFAFGDAGFFGSMGGAHLNQPIVGITSTPDGHGYLLVASDGGIFAFGDASFFGSMGGSHLNQPMVAIAANPDGTGYWTAAADGGVFSFGDAPFRGSASGLGVLQGIAANG
jgi:hypothetical protein